MSYHGDILSPVPLDSGLLLPLVPVFVTAPAHPVLTSEPHITSQSRARSEQKVQTLDRCLAIAESDGMRTIDQLAETRILLLFIPH